LVPFLKGESPEKERPIYSGGNHGRGVVIQGDWKYYRFNPELKRDRKKNFVRPQKEDSPLTYAEELYNLREDPREQHNLAERFPERIQMMRKRLDEWFSRYERSALGVGHTKKPDSTTVEELKSLGYLQ